MSEAINDLVNIIKACVSEDHLKDIVSKEPLVDNDEYTINVAVDVIRNLYLEKQELHDAIGKLWEVTNG